jgi:hypothetical protein
MSCIHNKRFDFGELQIFKFLYFGVADVEEGGGCLVRASLEGDGDRVIL